jgi:hypothetical protein
MEAVWFMGMVECIASIELLCKYFALNGVGEALHSDLR